MMTLITILSFSMKEANASQKPLGVTFKKLNVTVKKIKKHGYPVNEVTVEYKIRRGDWKQMDRYNINPKLTLATTRRNTRLKSLRLDRRKGRIQFHTHTRISDKINVRVSGKSSYARVDENGYKKQCDQWLKIPVQRFRKYDHGYSQNGGSPNQGGQGNTNHSDLLAVMNACKTRNVSKVDCSRLMRKVEQKRAPKIFKACAVNTKWGSEFKRCVSTAATVKRKAAKAVYACAAPSDGWNSNLISCLETVATIHYNPAPLIQACDKATQWFSEFKQCVKTAAPVADSTRVVEACDRATKWGSDLRRCIKSTKGIHDPASVVSLCAQTTDYASQLNRCVKKGGPYAYFKQSRSTSKKRRLYKRQRYTHR